jgi:cation:H+ antiporter
VAQPAAPAWRNHAAYESVSCPAGKGGLDGSFEMACVRGVIHPDAIDRNAGTTVNAVGPILAGFACDLPRAFQFRWMSLNVVFIVTGLVALYFGAEWLVKGATSLALKLGMSPLIAGLTVVAFGTSSPELVVSLTAVLKGQGDIALGNVVGSNIFNVAVILGLTAVMVPLKVQFQLLKVDTPVMVGMTFLFLWFFRDRMITHLEAVVFLILLVTYLAFSVWYAKREATRQVKQEFAQEMRDLEAGPSMRVPMMVLLIVAGLAALILGSRAFVSGAVAIARSFQIGEAVIGLTIVAAGTSLPELASSIVAAIRKQADVAVGNVIGSNVFNILAILGVSGAVAGPVEGAGITRLDLGYMTCVSVALIPIIWTGFTIRRWEGVVLLVSYGVYLVMVWPK